MSDSEDMQAVEDLYERYKQDVYRYALFTLGNPGDAEDATQEVFIRALRKWSSFRHDARPKTWLWSILRNYLTDVLRKRKKTRDFEDFTVDLSTITSVSMNTRLEWEELLKSLKLPQRQVIYCRLIENLSVAETAEMLGWKPTKVRVMYHRTLKRLREFANQDLYGVERECESHG